MRSVILCDNIGPVSCNAAEQAKRAVDAAFDELFQKALREAWARFAALGAGKDLGAGI